MSRDYSDWAAGTTGDERNLLRRRVGWGGWSSLLLELRKFVEIALEWVLCAELVALGVWLRGVRGFTLRTGVHEI
jgi:hypothetical protein